MLNANSRGKLDGLDVYLSIGEDYFTQISDDDGITPKQRQAWENDDWRYVTATVHLALDGIEIGSASYPMVEFGTFLLTNENDEITGTTEIDEDQVWQYVGDELAGQAIENAYEFSNAMQAWRVANPSAFELRDAARESA